MDAGAFYSSEILLLGGFPVVSGRLLAASSSLPASVSDLRELSSNLVLYVKCDGLTRDIFQKELVKIEAAEVKKSPLVASIWAHLQHW